MSLYVAIINSMSKAAYSLEDFVLDPEFRKWVLAPDKGTNLFWGEYLQNNPGKKDDIFLARKMVLNMSRFSFTVDGQRKEETIRNIHNAIRQLSEEEMDKKVVPIHSLGTLLRPIYSENRFPQISQFHRTAAILILTFVASALINSWQGPLRIDREETPLAFEEHFAPPGVKSNLTLQDGSKVILNSGSTLKYIKNFEPGQRELELYGEAYFEVAKDTFRPFIVKTGKVSTTALGTSFNIKAFEKENLDIALLSGAVSINIQTDSLQEVYLKPGEGLTVHPENQEISKGPFDRDKILAWTRKTILLDKAPIPEVRRILENWYGVHIHYQNSPSPDLEVSGKFHDQTLDNVLFGLSHSARFDFDIRRDQVYITFK